MTQNTRRCRWCKELYRGKCGCDAETMLEKIAAALESIRSGIRLLKQEAKIAGFDLCLDCKPCERASYGDCSRFQSSLNFFLAQAKVVDQALQEYRERVDAK